MERDVKESVTPAWMEDEEAGAGEELKALAPLQPASLTIGRVLGFERGHGPLLDFPGNNTGTLIVGRSTVSYGALAVGQEVALAFEEGDLNRPIITGVLQMLPNELTAEPVASLADLVKPTNSSLEVLEIKAEKEIVLRCGQASITLTKSGKVLIRGEYLLSRSSGANRIKGGSVQIN